jgi:hypothetical protein
MTLKQDHYIFALVGIGAVAVLYLLYKENQAAQDAAPAGIPVPVAGSQPQLSYPNSAPIDMGNVTINEAQAPSAQLYNTPFDASHFRAVEVNASQGTEHSGCGCPDQACDQAGIPVTRQHIPESILRRAVDNLASFQAKTTAPVSGVEAARITVSQAQSKVAPISPAMNTGGSLAAA